MRLRSWIMTIAVMPLDGPGFDCAVHAVNLPIVSKGMLAGLADGQCHFRCRFCRPVWVGNRACCGGVAAHKIGCRNTFGMMLVERL